MIRSPNRPAAGLALARSHPIIVQSTITENMMGRHSFAQGPGVAGGRKFAASDKFRLRFDAAKGLDVPGSAFGDRAHNHDRDQQSTGDRDGRQIRVIGDVGLEPPIAGAEPRISASIA